MAGPGDGHVSGGGGDEQGDDRDRAGAVRTVGRAGPGWGHDVVDVVERVVDVVERVVDVVATVCDVVGPVAPRGVAVARPVALAAAF
jgi:hypothetical protein